MTTKSAFLRRVQEVALQEGLDLQGDDRVLAVTGAVFGALHDVLTPEESRAVAHDLPTPLERLWQEPWENSWLAQVIARLRGPKHLDQDDFYRQVARNGNLPDGTAPAAVKGVFTALRETVPAPVARHIAGELPLPLREIWQGRSASADLLLSHEEEAPEGLVGEVPVGEWTSFLAGLSAHYQASPVRIYVVDPDGETFEVVSHMPLIGMEPENEPDGVRAIDVVVGETGGMHPEHLLHRAERPNRIFLRVNPAGYAHILNIEQADGSKTMVRFAA